MQSTQEEDTKMRNYIWIQNEMKFIKEGREVLLSRTEQKLLKILLENRGNTIPKERMLEKIWPDGTEFVEENALSVAVSKAAGKDRG